MKKIILLFTLMFSLLSFGQETFEGAWPPPGWAVTVGTNGNGAEEIWHPSQPGPYQGHNSVQAAFVDRVNIGMGNTEEDWLIMNLQTIPQDGQLRFWTRQTQSGDQSTIYQIRVSTNADQMALGEYDIVQTYTEAQLTDLNGDLSQYTEKFINFENVYFGEQAYVAFVRVVTQTGPGPAGDRWLIDDVNIVQRCVDPDALDVAAATILSTSAVLTWNNNSISDNFEVEVLPASEIPTGVANFSGTGESVTATGLLPGTLMQFFVRSMCAGSPSQWTGPFFFLTLPLGSVCSDPISVGILPYQAVGVNTGNYGDEFDTAQGASCGAVPAGTNYMAGHEIFYSYTADANGVVSITMTPGTGETNTGVFVYEGCSNVGVTCYAGVANTNANVRSLLMNVVAGQTYIIVVSSATANQTAVFDILIQKEDCTPKPTNGGVVPGSQTTTSALLTWDSIGITSWEVAVQPLGSTVPQGAGEYYTGGLPFPANGLVSGNQYQFWVRSECGVGSGVFSAWAGPYPFSPLLCNASDKCGYVFRLTDTASNGWQGNTLTVFQNGQPVVLSIENNVPITTIGSTFTAGAGPHDVIVPLCPGYPYEIFWNNGGSNPNQIRFEVINPFGQVEYAKTTGSTTRNITLYTSNVAVDCTAPNCTIPPSAVATSNITTTGFTLSWAAPSTGMAETFTWDIYILPAGSGVPSAFTPPTYNDVTVADPLNPVFVTVNPLLPDTCYEIYIRVNCEPTNSEFSTMVTVCTLPTCYKPVINPATTVTDIGLNSATFTWTPGSPTDTSWEILLIQSETLPEGVYTPVPDDGELYTYTAPAGPEDKSFTVNDLDPAKIYHFFIRTVCPGDDKSTWTGPVKFNTITCLDTDKCVYKFVLTDAGGNGWNGGRMQVRQNGIVVFDLVMTSGSTITRSVSLCTGVPFDVYWSVTGTQPQDMGFSVQNPFLDVLFTYEPGSGVPQTIVYANASANCTDNPCAKPTNIAAEVTSATTATLTWTDNSSPDASTAFDVYIVETGGAAPINDPATAPTHPGVSMPFNITSLDPSTSYTFYVRAQCGDAQFSTWTILSPVTFITEPINDECIDAITVTVNTGQICGSANNAPGNTLGATASAPVLDPPLTGSGCLVNNRDVWYKFVASHTSHTISIIDMVVTPASAQASFKLNYSVFSGECTDLEKVACYTTETGVITGLEIGEEYYIRVYPSNNNASQSAEFKLCITSPPANDECANAPTVQVNTTWSCSPALYAHGNTLGASGSLPTVTGAGCGTTDDDVWFKFTASSAIHVISLNNIVGSSSSVSLNHGLYSGPCDAFVKLYCSTNTESVATNLTPGETYWVRIYTAASTAGQHATFDLCINTPPPPGPNDECENAVPVAVNPDSKCTLKTYGNLIGATASGGNTSCIGTEDDDVWFSFVALSPRHIISLLNVVGTTTDLNHAVYQGSCGALVQKYCSTAGTLQSVSAANAFVIGQTYYVRVWSNSAVSQVVAFDICIKSVSTCENAESFCGSSAEDPYIYENTTGIPDNTQVACLGSIPNPTFYTLHVGQTGPLYFTLYQAGGFDENGNPVGPTRDVDYVAWGPFTTPESCNEISFTDCPTCPFSNVGSNFYPFGNIVDCSYSASFTETLSIPNAQEGEFYIILVTNFSNQPGFIRMVQTNYSAPNAGTTICCDVDLGDDISVCAESVEINALLEMDPSAPIPDVYEWFFNDSLTPIAGQTAATLTVTESGTYRVKALCGLNSVEDSINVTLGPVIEVDTPSDYTECELVATDDFALFDLASLASQLGLADLSLYEITYHTNPTDAADEDAVGLDVSAAATYASQTIYIRVESLALDTCYSVVPVNLIVSQLADPAFSYDAASYCTNATADPVITISGVAGAFTSDPDGLSIDAATGAISLAGSAPGTYTITNTILGTTENQCADVSATATVTITAAPVATFDYAEEFYCSTAANPSPAMVGTGTAGVFTSTPAGLVIDPATGVIDIAASTAGTYTVFNTHAAASGCVEVQEQDVVTITTAPDAEFTYSATQYCTDDTDPAPIFTTGAAGVFTADSNGISIDPATGVISLGGSDPGTYVITNTFAAADGCDEISESFTVQLNDPATAEFGYANASYCTDGGTALPVFEAGAIAGMFTATPAGLSINSATGEINLGASSEGTYTVTNQTNATGACPTAFDTFTVTITAPYSGVISYTGGEFCKSSTSEVISNTAPAGGTYTSGTGLSINNATGEIDPSQSIAGVYEVVYTLPANGGCGEFETATFVTIFPQSSVSFDAICISTDYTVTAVPSDDSFDPLTATYSWTTADGEIKAGTANSQSVVVTAKGVYTVTVTTPDGCSVTENHSVTNVRCMFQKGISPDGNGDNDSFDLTGYNVKHISIFNRYGTMVFQWDNYTNEWHGQDNSGDELTDGTYFFVIDTGDREESGWIYLNR